MQFPRWLSNPYIGMVGLIVSVGSLIFGVYVYKQSQESRELWYAVSPERTILIDSNKASEFEIYHKIVLKFANK